MRLACAVPRLAARLLLPADGARLRAERAGILFDLDRRARAGCQAAQRSGTRATAQRGLHPRRAEGGGAQSTRSVRALEEGPRLAGGAARCARTYGFSTVR